MTKISIVPAVRVFIVYIILFLLTLHYARTHFYRDPGSLFYDERRGNERYYSLERESEAEIFFQTAHTQYDAGNTTNLVNVAGPDPLICATVISVFRPNVERQYVYTTVGSILAGMTQQERSALHLGILFADTEPTRNTPFTEPWFLSLLDNPFSRSSLEIPKEVASQWQQWASESKFEQKGILDYTFALQHCLDVTQAPYIAIFEDDILLADGWLVKALAGARDADSLSLRTAGSKDAWLDFRMFNQERSVGFSSQAIGGNNEALISAAVSIPVALGLFLLRQTVPQTRAQLNTGTILIVTMIAIPSFIILFFQSGKASVLPPRPGVHVEDFGCCSQALVFNRAHVQALIDYLRTRAPDYGGTRYDMMTRDFARESLLSRLAMYPMLVQHVGFSSASGTHSEEARKVWSMAFEDLDKDKLAREHQKLVDEVFGTNL